MTKFQQIINGRVVSLADGHMPQFLVGLDASKPATPGKGDTYYSSDTAKIYNCFVSGFWTCTYSPGADEYINRLGILDNYLSGFNNMSSGGAITTPSSISNMSLQLQTGATGTGSISVRNLSLSEQLIPSFPYIINFIIDTIVDGAATGASVVATQLGLNSDFMSYHGNLQSLACFIQKTDGTWYTATAHDALGGITENSITAPTTGDILTILATTNVCVFYKNGALLHQHTTNLPTITDSMYFGAGILVTTAAMSGERLISFRHISKKKLY